MVLVVGDNPQSNELLVRILHANGYRAVGTDRAADTAALAADALPRCIVLDIASKGIGTTLQILDAVRTHGDERVHSARIIVVARSASNRNFSFQSGADAYLLRPFHANELLRTVDEVLQIPLEDLPEYRRSQLAASS